MGGINTHILKAYVTFVSFFSQNSSDGKGIVHHFGDQMNGGAPN
jgi:hypothetical protein